MKKNILSILSLFILVAVIFSACEPETYTLGKAVSKADLEYTITPNPADPNMLILKSLTPNATPLWITPMGRSTRLIDTVRLAFPGEYKFQYGAMSAGGFVQADEVTISVTTSNLSYVNDPLWTLLTGGVGKEKTWVLDLNAESTTKYFAGPLFFYGTNNGWLAGGDNGCYGADCWNWSPDYKGNSWLMTAGDYGSMTFSLKGNAVITVEHKMLGRNQTGTYFLDADAKTLKMTDAAPLHDAGRDGVVIDWGALKVLSLTENTMQLAALRDPALSGEGACLLVYNFITKEYSDNWVPEEKGDPNINVDLGGQSAGDLIARTNSKVWALSSETPFNWASLEGAMLNNWDKLSDYPEWAEFNAEAAAIVGKNKIEFVGDGTVKFTDSDANETEGTYTIDEATNIITFEGAKPAFKMGGWAVAEPNALNQWRIVKTKKTGSTITDIWFGKRDAVKPEYMVFHFVLASSAVDPAVEAKKLIISALCGPTGTRSFKVSDSWHVDWVNADLSGGWTSATTFADDFTSNNWVWTQEVKDALQEPRLTFTLTNGVVTCTKTQDGNTTTANVTIDAMNSKITVDMDLIEFKGSANWLPKYGPTWNITRTDLANITADGMWLGVPTVGKEATEKTIIHYVVAE